MIYSIYKKKRIKENPTKSFQKAQRWFFFITKNQFTALENVYNKSPNSVWVTSLDYIDLLPEKYRSNTLILEDYYNTIKWYTPLLFGLRIFLFSPLKTIKYGDGMYQIAGMERLFPFLLNKYSPEAVIFSNDHSPICLSLLHFCKKAEVTSIYIQHAAVTEYFPNLEFDLALLEGEDSFEKYKKIGNIKSKVEIVGAPRFEQFMEMRNTSTRCSNIGICYGKLDDINEVEALLIQLLEQYGIKICIRAHPQDNRLLSPHLCDQIEFSNARTENPFQFLSRQDVIFSGNSTILLEAVMMNCTACYCSSFNRFVFDYYGFFRNNVVDCIREVDQVANYLGSVNRSSPIYLKSKFYNEAIGSDYETDVSDKCVDLIDDFLNNRNNDQT